MQIEGTARKRRGGGASLLDWVGIDVCVFVVGGFGEEGLGKKWGSLMSNLKSLTI